MSPFLPQRINGIDEGDLGMGSNREIGNVEGRIALVTGGSSGIGAEIARQLAWHGAAVAIVGRDEPRLASSLADLTAAGTEGLAIQADLTSDGEPERAVAETVERFGGLDVLVNAAGVIRPALIEDAAARFAEEWAINVTAPYELTRVAIPHLRKRGGAALFISSVSGKKGFARGSGYCATKGAIELMVKALAIEEAEHGVRINAIAPGEIRTDLNPELLDDPEYMKLVMDATPMKRIGEVQEVAPAAVFLVSDDAGYITGTSLDVDGGWAAK
jgi:NAD(P)-dependent dehydrogenase (short-subunit alcohol dehydrogenase family)